MEIHLCEVPRIDTFTETEDRIEEWGEGKNEKFLFHGSTVCAGRHETLCVYTVMMVIPHWECN